jgi:hypothetical protein
MSRQSGTRKCDCCKASIDVRKKDQLDNVVRHKGKYYHKQCFIELAESRVASNTRHSASWQEALDNINQLVEDAKNSITNRYNTDPLNDYLLLNYDVASLSARFWTTINDIGNGAYKYKRCKPIDSNTLLDMWKLYKKDLDQIYAWNKSKGKDMTGESRIVYELSILMNKHGDYLKHISKMKAIEAEVVHSQPQTKINYNNFDNNTTHTDDIDILSLLDEIF